jgi:hypothetical protein
MAAVVDVHVPEAEQTRVAMENLSTPTPAALSELFPAADARRML